MILLFIPFVFLIIIFVTLTCQTKPSTITIKYSNTQKPDGHSNQISTPLRQVVKVVKSEKKDKDERLFGKFKCSKCKKHWQSAHAYRNKTQACKMCMVSVLPYELQKLEKVEDDENKIDKEKHHIQELCGKCAELGYNCSLRYTRRNDYVYSKPSYGYGIPPFRPKGRLRYSRCSDTDFSY